MKLTKRQIEIINYIINNNGDCSNSPYDCSNCSFTYKRNPGFHDCGEVLSIDQYAEDDELYASKKLEAVTKILVDYTFENKVLK